VKITISSIIGIKNFIKMEKIIFLLFAGMFAYTANAQSQAYEVAESTSTKSNVQLIQNGDIEQNYSPSSLLYDNGPLINSAGTGSGGADESVLQNTSLGMNILGFGHQVSSDNWIADDFVITDNGGWDLSSLVFYAYQTGSTTTPTMDDLRIMIYDDSPDQPGANVVWGDATTNVFSSVAWSGVYRVDESTSGASNRPIMAITSDVNFHLDPGTYWIAWQVGGTLPSGPWAPPITINGQTTTGNAMQSIAGNTSYAALTDSGTLTGQGLPFLVYGEAVAAVPISDWAVVISMLLIIVVVSSRFVVAKL